MKLKMIVGAVLAVSQTMLLLPDTASAASGYTVQNRPPPPYRPPGPPPGRPPGPPHRPPAPPPHYPPPRPPQPRPPYPPPSYPDYQTECRYLGYRTGYAGETIRLRHLLGLDFRYRGYSLDRVEIRLSETWYGNGNVSLYLNERLFDSRYLSDYVTFVLGGMRLDEQVFSAQVFIPGQVRVESICATVSRQRWGW